MSDNIQTNTTGRLTPCLQQKIDKTRYLVEIHFSDTSKHNGESRISYRGRKRLRYVLYEAAVSLVGKNAEFRQIHEYYRTR